MKEQFDRIWETTIPAFRQKRTFERAKALAYGALVCLGRHTLTGIIDASGNSTVDWSAAYRLFSEERMKIDTLFSVTRRHVLDETEASQPLVVMLDDTLLRKNGRKIHGAKWLRDPLGPPFHTNFIWGQRFLQISMALPEKAMPSQARAIPVDWHHCPMPHKPGKNATEEQMREYKTRQKLMKLSRQGALRIQTLRDNLDQDGTKQRSLIVCTDGSYTNKEVLKNLPERTTLIGRIRKDAKLYALPEDAPNQKGRKRLYGEQIPTPDELRKDDTVAWETVKAWAAGKEHSFQVKSLAPVRWRAAGGQMNLRLIVIRPLRYKKTKQGNFLYKNPGYLICTDPKLPILTIIQSYIWRWEIEGNFRDEKTLLGCGEAQVRTKQAVQTVPAFIVAAYACLLLAAHAISKQGMTPMIQRPKWYKRKNDQRMTTSESINLLRTELWGRKKKEIFSHFMFNQNPTRSGKNYLKTNGNPFMAIRK